MSETNIYLKSQELVDYPGKKLPVLFLIDISGSMSQCTGGTPTGEYEYKDGINFSIVKNGGPSLMDKLCDQVQKWHDAMCRNSKTSATCQTAYMTFGNDATLIEDFSVVAEKEPPIDKLKAKDDKTYIVKALNKALSLLDEQKKFLKAHGSYQQPWLIILTDGRAMDDPAKLAKIQEELVARQNDGHLVVYSIALSDDEELVKQLEGYSINDVVPHDTDGVALEGFFKYLERSVTSISNSKMTNRIPPYVAPKIKGKRDLS